MKVSMKELKIEQDGSEIAYFKELGFVLNTKTFSMPEKCKAENEKDKDPHGTLELLNLIQLLTGIPESRRRDPSRHEAVMVEPAVNEMLEGLKRAQARESEKDIELARLRQKVKELESPQEQSGDKEATNVKV